MKIIRYVAFIPGALLVSIVIGALTNYVGAFLFGDLIGWIVSGSFSGISFVYLGLKISPSKTELIKYVLVGFLITISILAIIGSYLGDRGVYSFSAPIVTFLIGIGAISIPIDEII